MNYYYKGKAKYISAFTAMMVFIVVALGTSKSQYFNQIFYKTLTSDTVPSTIKKESKPTSNKKKILPVLQKDSLKLVKQITLNDSLNTVSQSDTGIITQVQKIDSFDVKISKDSLNAPVVYHADDSMVIHTFLLSFVRIQVIFLNSGHLSENCTFF